MKLSKFEEVLKVLGMLGVPEKATFKEVARLEEYITSNNIKTLKDAQCAVEQFFKSF